MRSVMEECGGVHIHFPAEGSGVDRVMIRGPAGEVERARKQLLQLAEEKVRGHSSFFLYLLFLIFHSHFLFLVCCVFLFSPILFFIFFLSVLNFLMSNSHLFLSHLFSHVIFIFYDFIFFLLLILSIFRLFSCV